MTLSRIMGHALVIAYLVIVALGAMHAARRFETVPFSRITMFMYGMLAPYQGYSETAEGYMAEGLIQGRWYPIDLAPYYPVLAGERSMREWHTSMNWAYFPSNEDAHRAVAEQLFALEQRVAHGRMIEALRLSWIQWRPAPEGYRIGSSTPLQSRILVIVP